MAAVRRKLFFSDIADVFKFPIFKAIIVYLERSAHEYIIKYHEYET